MHSSKNDFMDISLQKNYVGMEDWVTTIIYYDENEKTIKQKELFWM